MSTKQEDTNTLPINAASEINSEDNASTSRLTSNCKHENGEEEEEEEVDSEEDFLLHMEEEEAEKQSSKDCHQPKSASAAPKLLQDALKKGDIKPDESEDEEEKGRKDSRAGKEATEEKKDNDEIQKLKNNAEVQSASDRDGELEKTITEHIHHRVSFLLLSMYVLYVCIVRMHLCM